jgi:hypothetical protein
MPKAMCSSKKRGVALALIGLLAGAGAVQCGTLTSDKWTSPTTLEARLCAPDAGDLDWRPVCDGGTSTLFVTPACKECIDQNAQCCDSVQSCFADPLCVTCYARFTDVDGAACVPENGSGGNTSALHACLFSRARCGSVCFPACSL